MQSLDEMTVWSQSLRMQLTKLDANFAAIIGTPVPAVIGTDYHALKTYDGEKDRPSDS